MTTPIIRGILPALISPMNQDGTALNLASARRLVDHLLDRGVDGFFVCGGTGEGLLMNLDERRALLEAVVDQNQGRGSVVAHIGALATPDAQTLARHAVSLGVDAVAAVPPVYFRVDRKAIIDHYRLIAEAADGTPTHVYNIPSATGVEINADLMADLLQIPGVSGIKYSSYNLFDMQRIINLRSDLTVLSGFDEVCVGGLALGAHGAIGSTYNVMPSTFSALFRATQSGNWEEARALQVRANKVIEALLSVPIFAAIKLLLTQRGIDCGSPRRPQRPLTAAEVEILNQGIAAAGLDALEAESLALLRETAHA
jgi:N-acetylneuraminate lyase